MSRCATAKVTGGAPLRIGPRLRSTRSHSRYRYPWYDLSLRSVPPSGFRQVGYVDHELFQSPPGCPPRCPVAVGHGCDGAAPDASSPPMAATVGHEEQATLTQHRRMPMDNEEE